MRGIGEPIWAGRTELELVESQRHESLLNVTFAPDTSLWLRCPYDTGALSAAVIDEARRSHEFLMRAGAGYSSAEFRGVGGSAGLWLANQLCDLVQIRSFAAGTVVRLHMRRSAA
jgi:hypothetical protein